MYYVYILIDPRDNSPFYIGKGKGDRFLNHEKEACRYLKTGLAANAVKCERINDIIACGKAIKYVFDSEHCLESDAYKRESELISSTPGLTNKAKGQKVASRKVSLNELLGQWALSRPPAIATRIYELFPLEWFPYKVYPKEYVQLYLAPLRWIYDRK